MDRRDLLKRLGAGFGALFLAKDELVISKELLEPEPPKVDPPEINYTAFMTYAFTYNT